MITLSNIKLEIDIPALNRIAEALEGMNKQLNAIRITQGAIEERLLDITHQLEDLSLEQEASNKPTKVDLNPYR